jgi:murein DD-endopeptidase MepM/ murein hydrolase activator NlpD
VGQGSPNLPPVRPPSGWAGETGAILLLGLVLLIVGIPRAQADDRPVDPASGRLEEITVALEGEATALRRLSAALTGPGGKGVSDLAGYLAAAEVRVWQWQVEASEAVAAELVGSVPVGWDVEGDGFPALGSPGLEDGPGPLRGRWVVYQRALGRAVESQERLAAWLAAVTRGLPRPGRVCPVDGPAEFSPTWGEERPWGRTHRGEDVHADYGTPLVAVESGTVLQAGWHWQGGFGVWLEGHYSGSVYYYAHLSGIVPGVRPGARVEVGSLLGWVGSTGNATSPHLHFGWIPEGPERWLDLEGLTDPYPLLAGLCR